MGSPEPGRCSSQICKTCGNHKQDCDRELPSPRIGPGLLDPILHQAIVTDRLIDLGKASKRFFRLPDGIFSLIVSHSGTQSRTEGTYHKHARSLVDYHRDGRHSPTAASSLTFCGANSGQLAVGNITVNEKTADNSDKLADRDS